MSLSVETDILLSLGVEEAFDQDVYCEHGSHRWDTDKHWGPSKWYMKLACPNCGWATGLLAVCDPWKRYVLRGGKVICYQSCDQGAPGVEWLQMVEQIRKD